VVTVPPSFDFAALREAGEAVCALANDLESSAQPGFLLIGLHDDGSPAGLRIDDATLQKLAQIRSDGMLQPLPSLAISKASLPDGDVAVIEVQPTDDPPMRHRGRIWVRVGPTTQVASAQDERRLVERRHAMHQPFDHTVVHSARLEDPLAFAPEVLERNERTAAERLEALRLAHAEMPTIAGVIVLAPNPRLYVPGAYIQFVRFAGSDVTSPIQDQREIIGKISGVLSDVVEVLKINNQVALSIGDAATDVKRPQYSVAALQEHLAAMFSEMGLRVLAVDLDPQSNLSAMCIDDLDMLEWFDAADSRNTLFGAVEPIMDGLGDYYLPKPYAVSERFGLLVGDLGLSRYEDFLAEAWSTIFDQRRDALLKTTAFARIQAQAAMQWEADVVLIDVGPNLGALNRAALIGADDVIIPLAPDLFSIQALRNLGPTLRSWRSGWRDRRYRFASPPFAIPIGRMEPLGYVVMQHAMRLDRPVLAYGRWMAQIPTTYERFIQNREGTPGLDARQDSNCLAMLKNYRSLMPLAMDAHRPMFMLTPGDGAIGAQQDAVRSCYRDFEELAKTVAARIGLQLPLYDVTVSARQR